MSSLFRDITCIQADGTVTEHAYVAVEQSKITYVGTEEPQERNWGEIIDGRKKLLMPGLVNSHTHVPMVLMRGYGDDMPLDRWLNDRIFPFEAKLTGEDVYWGSLLGIAEMLSSGTVAFTEMYDFCDRIAGAVSESGIKANIGRGFTCFDPAKKLKDIPAYGEIVGLLEQYHGSCDGRIRIDVAPHSEYTTRPDLLADAAELAARYGVRMHVHVSETNKEHGECVGRHGKTPVKVMQDTGVLSRPVTLAHCVWLTDEDMDMVASAPDATVAHCAKSNLKLGSGVASVEKMRSRGVSVAIGTDSAASNNGLDMLEEMRMASYIAKGVFQEPEAMKASTVLNMATRVGALSQGRQDCGDIRPGYRADMVALDMDKICMTPCHNPLSNLVYAANCSTVALTMVDGKVLYRNGEFTTIDIERVAYQVRSCVTGLLER